MKIIELKAENIKNIKAIEIRPVGDTVVLTGKNGAGKSAVMDAIFMAICGSKYEKPVRDGSERGEVTVDLGDYKVKRIWTQGGDSGRLEVTNSDGAKYPSPQALLNSLVGSISFDPQSFRALKPKDQREVLIDLTGLDLSGLDAKRQAAYDERTLINHDLTNKKALYASAEPIPDDAPTKMTNTGDLLAEKNILDEKLSAYNVWRNNLDEAIEDELVIAGQLKNALEEVEKLREQVRVVNADILRFKENRVQPVHESEFERVNIAISAVDDQNRLFTEAEVARQNIANLTDQVIAAEMSSKEKTAEIKKLDTERIEKLAACEMPIDGLSFDDKSILYNNIPYSRLSIGEQIKVSTAIAMALNPKLKVIFIRDGSLLDDEGMRIVTALAKDKDYQLWIEKVGDPTAVSVHIEDGEIVTK